MKKATITPKRKAKVLSDEALAVSADKLLNVLSKNTQEEKVYCLYCQHYGYPPGTFILSHYTPKDCQLPSCFITVDEFDYAKSKRVDTASKKNANNNCPDFERNIPTVKPDVDVAPQEVKPTLDTKPSLWQRIFSWNK